MDDKLFAEMSAFSDENKDFRDFVLSNAKSYGKTPIEVLEMKTTYYVYKGYQKGGCNEPKQRS